MAEHKIVEGLKEAAEIARSRYPASCHSCGADFDGGPIPENMREHYSPPYRWSRAIAVVDPAKDRQVEWRCPDCHFHWPI